MGTRPTWAAGEDKDAGASISEILFQWVLSGPQIYISPQIREVLWKRGEVCRIRNNFPDPSHRSQKPTLQGLLPNRQSWQLSRVILRAQDWEDLKHLHRLPGCIGHPPCPRVYLEGKSCGYCREWTVETWLKHTETLRTSTASKKVAVTHGRGHQTGRRQRGAELRETRQTQLPNGGLRTSNLATTPYTSRARSIQLSPSLHKEELDNVETGLY